MTGRPARPDPDGWLGTTSLDGFNVGVSVPSPTDIGNLIQGNFIGDFVLYPVDPQTGSALPAPNSVELVYPGNAQQGVILGSTNTTVGGVDAQDNNVISGNGDAKFKGACLGKPLFVLGVSRSGENRRGK